jgi:phosphoribosylformylglycinamidine synthase subunit PurS
MLHGFENDDRLIHAVHLHYRQGGCLYAGTEIQYTKMKARVFVTMKPSVLDAQGQAVRTALQSMGHSMVQDVRQGKYFELDLSATDRSAASAELEKISHEILSNPVIEQYRVEILD